MASIRKRGETYQIIVSCGYSANGKKILKTTTWDPPEGLTPKQLEKALQHVTHEYEKRVKTGQCMDDSVTLAEFSDRWVKEYAVNQLEPTTLESYLCELRTKILPALGHIRLSKLKPINIQSFLNNLLEDGVRIDKKPGCYSNRTVKYQHAILSSILQTAVYWQIIPSNPCERVKVPKKKSVDTEKKLKFFTDDQAFRFLEAARGEETKYQAIAAIAIYGGLRRGEILGLTWSDVDLDSGIISVNRSNAYLAGKGVITKSTKNSGSKRSISLPDEAIALLRKHRQEQSEVRMQLGELWQQNNMVFTQWNGAPMYPGTPRHWMWDLIRKYNKSLAEDRTLSDQERANLALPLIPFHGLRHTSATLLIAGNTDVKTVSARLGHAQTSTIMNIYSHALQKLDRQAADTLSNMIHRRSDGKKTKG